MMSETLLFGCLVTVSGLLKFIEQVSQASRARPTRYLDAGTFRRRSNSGKTRRQSTVHGIVKRSCSIQADSVDGSGASASIARVAGRRYMCVLTSRRLLMCVLASCRLLMCVLASRRLFMCVLVLRRRFVFIKPLLSMV